MKRWPHDCGLSLTELLVVVSIILILASVMIVTVGGLHGQAVQLQCQHRLEELGKACLAFANEHGRLPRAYDPQTYRRWYDALFIGGAPRAADIQQGGIGSCYFLATLTNVVSQDPAHIQGAISGSGAAVSVNFFRYDAASTTWLPVTISIDNTLVHSIDASGADQGMLGSGFLVGDSPLRSEWWASAHHNVLGVHRDDLYEGALWAPLFEKAYAAFAETYGQYGGYDTANAHNNTNVSGYQTIEGGFADYVYMVMYGDDADTDETAMSFTAGADLVAANLPAIENLLRVMGDGVGANEEFMLSSMLSSEVSIERLGAQVDYILGLPSSQRYPTFRIHMQKMQTEIADWKAASNNDKAGKQDLIMRRARNFATPGNWPLLHYDSSPDEYKDLNEMCNIVMNLGDDESNGQRHTYASHSYAVLSASFQDSNGQALAVTIANLPTTAANIDPDHSQVTLRNPHGTNEPNPHGGSEGADADDGVFALSLGSYLRSFELQRHALVQT